MALITAHLNAGHSGGDSVAIGTYSPSHLHTPFPPFSPSLISLMVSVDVKHHVYLLTYYLNYLHVLLFYTGFSWPWSNFKVVSASEKLMYVNVNYFFFFRFCFSESFQTSHELDKDNPRLILHPYTNFMNLLNFQSWEAVSQYLRIS